MRGGWLGLVAILFYKASCLVFFVHSLTPPPPSLLPIVLAYYASLMLLCLLHHILFFASFMLSSLLCCLYYQFSLRSYVPYSSLVNLLTIKIQSRNLRAQMSQVRQLNKEISMTHNDMVGLAFSSNTPICI